MLLWTSRPNWREWEEAKTNFTHFVWLLSSICLHCNKQIKTFVIGWPGLLVQQNLSSVLMSGAFYNVSTGDPPCLPSLSLLWASAVVEAHIGILFAGSWAAARSGRPAWKKCWCVLESGLPPAATTTFLINHTFHLSDPTTTGKTRLPFLYHQIISPFLVRFNGMSSENKIWVCQYQLSLWARSWDLSENWLQMFCPLALTQ